MRELTSPDGLVALRLTVNNHPGAMSHVISLFARRFFSLEGLVAPPAPDGAPADLWVLVRRSDRLEQIVSQVSKLHDVLGVKVSEVQAGALTGLTAGLEARSSGG